jgi:hypothetical protein
MADAAYYVAKRVSFQCEGHRCRIEVIIRYTV